MGKLQDGWKRWTKKLLDQTPQAVQQADEVPSALLCLIQSYDELDILLCSLWIKSLVFMWQNLCKSM
jgi:hypothetical protein